MMSHPKAIGAAAAALGFCQMCFAGTVAFVQGLIYDGTALPMLGGSGGFKCDRTGDLALPSSMSVERLSETLGRSY